MVVLYLYLGIGLLFALWFVAGAINKLDPGVPPRGWPLKIMLLPGLIVLWPVFLKKIVVTQRRS